MDQTLVDINQELTGVFEGYQGRREEIIPLLQAVQEKFSYLPSEGMKKIAEFTRVPASSVFAVATFYAQFRFEPLGRNHIMVCRGTACHVRGAQAILEEMTDELGLEGEGTTEDQEYTVETVACIGCCALAPVITVNEEVHGNLSKNKVRKLLRDEAKKNGRE
jgi:NADH-quinone oxidoreductase subunit E